MAKETKKETKKEVSKTKDTPRFEEPPKRKQTTKEADVEEKPYVIRVSGSSHRKDRERNSDRGGVRPDRVGKDKDRDATDRDRDRARHRQDDVPRERRGEERGREMESRGKEKAVKRPLRSARSVSNESFAISDSYSDEEDSNSESFSGSSSEDGESNSASTTGKRKKRRGKEKKRQKLGVRAAAASGFSAHLDVRPPPGNPPEEITSSIGGTNAQATRGGVIVFGPAPPPGNAASSTALAVLPETVRGLLDSSHLAQEVLALKQSLGVLPVAVPKETVREEPKETVIKMPARLHENLLHPDNLPRLLARTGLASATLNEEGLVVLRADSRKVLLKALGTLRRVAYHCQWGANKAKVASLLADRPTKPVTSIVIRMAATSSRLQSHESRLTSKVRKLRIGSQASACLCAVEGIPGLSRKHCTVTFEPERGACYVQDLSTNGTYLNGKRLPRPPYKSPQDARVRLFHGDELFFRLRTEDAEELGFVVNLVELG